MKLYFFEFVQVHVIEPFDQCNEKSDTCIENHYFWYWQISDFDHRDFLLLKVFYLSDRTCQDEQKISYNLPSKVPLEFSRNS